MGLPPFANSDNPTVPHHTRLAREQIHNCDFDVLGRLVRVFALIQYNRLAFCLFLSRLKTSLSPVTVYGKRNAAKRSD